MRFIKLDSTGQQLPADAAEWVAVLDTTANLIWSAQDVTKKEVNHKGAADACSKLTLCGVDGWRLPTVEELFLLADRSRHRPAIDTDFFPTCKSDWYWTSTPWSPSPESHAWIVGFYLGSSVGRGLNFKASVHAVRAPLSPRQ